MLVTVYGYEQIHQGR